MIPILYGREKHGYEHQQGTESRSDEEQRGASERARRHGLAGEFCHRPRHGGVFARRGGKSRGRCGLRVLRQRASRVGGGRAYRCAFGRRQAAGARRSRRRSRVHRKDRRDGDDLRCGREAAEFLPGQGRVRSRPRCDERRGASALRSRAGLLRGDGDRRRRALPLQGRVEVQCRRRGIQRRLGGAVQKLRRRGRRGAGSRARRTAGIADCTAASRRTVRARSAARTASAAESRQTGRCAARAAEPRQTRRRTACTDCRAARAAADRAEEGRAEKGPEGQPRQGRRRTRRDRHQSQLASAAADEEAGASCLHFRRRGRNGRHRPRSRLPLRAEGRRDRLRAGARQ